MINKIKTHLWFFVRWIIWIKDNIFDNPKIDFSKCEKYKTVIWKTVEWRDIECYTFWKWSKKILYFWWTHWNEVWTVKLMNKWINFLQEKPENIDLWDVQIFVIPCLNLDWYAKAKSNPEYFSWWRMWKVNANQVDLNRNFPSSNWSTKSTLFAAWKHFEVSWWTSAWSEPETKILLKLIEENNIKTIYAYHNCWWTVFWKWSDTVVKKEKSYSEKSWYRIYWNDEYTSLADWRKTGMILEWAKEKQIDTIEIEMRTRYWSEWKQNKNALTASVNL